MTFDHTKPFRCRDGREAVFLGEIPADDLCGDYCGRSIAARVHNLDGWEIRAFTRKGEFDPAQGETGWDLVNVPQKHKRWVNVYRHQHDTEVLISCSSRGGADAAAFAITEGERIACIEIEFTEGDGL